VNLYALLSITGSHNEKKFLRFLISSSNKTIFAKHFIFYSFIAILLIFIYYLIKQ